MANKRKVSEKIKSTLTELSIGDTAFFSIDNMGSVRTTTSQLWVTKKQKFTTKQLNEKRLLEVKRLS